MGYVFINNKLLESQNAAIPLDDRGFLYGESVFTTIRCYSGKPFLLEKHISRINSTLGSGYISGNARLSYEDISDKIKVLLEKNNCPDTIVRLRVTGGCGSGPLRPENPENNIIITSSPLHINEELYKNGAALAVTSIKRGKSALLSRHKLGNYLECIIARNEAAAAGAYEGIILSEDGNVLECACSNIFAVKNGELITPPLSENILPGIARKRVIECATANSIKCKEKSFSLEFLKTAESAFITNCAIEIIPVNCIIGITDKYNSISEPAIKTITKCYHG